MTHKRQDFTPRERESVKLLEHGASPGMNLWRCRWKDSRDVEPRAQR